MFSGFDFGHDPLPTKSVALVMAGGENLSLITYKNCHEKSFRGHNLYPIGSMGMVYLPTRMVDFYGKCRYMVLG